MVVTGPQRLQVVDEIEQFVEEKKWVGINDLSTCLRRIVVGSDLKVKPSSVGIGTLILNFLKPYDEVLPQMLRRALTATPTRDAPRARSRIPDPCK